MYKYVVLILLLLLLLSCSGRYQSMMDGQVWESGDTTPSVRGTYFRTANERMTFISKFDDVEDGQVFWIIFGDSNTVLESGGMIVLEGDLDFPGNKGDLLRFLVMDGSSIETDRVLRR